MAIDGCSWRSMLAAANAYNLVGTLVWAVKVRNKDDAGLEFNYT